MAKKKIEELMEGKSPDEVTKRLLAYSKKKEKRAFMLGKVSILVEDGYTPLEISKRLGIAESSARRFVHDVELVKY